MNTQSHLDQPNDPEQILVTRITEFIRLARDNGFKVGLGEGLDACRMAKHFGVLNKDRLRWGLRSLICSDLDDWERFDELFEAYWGQRQNTRQQHIKGAPAQKKDEQQQNKNNKKGNQGSEGAAADADGQEAEQSSETEAGEDGSKGGASARESLMTSNFQFLTDDGRMREMERLAERLLRRMRKRLLRRQKIQPSKGKLDLRRTFRKSLATGGLPINLAFRSRKKKLPRLILVCDVSRSMSMYSYTFMRFFRGIVGLMSDAHAFAYHTRLINITESLREQDLRKAKEKMALISGGWSGGTRIGDCLDKLNDMYGRLFNSRTVLVIVSDGLDAGEPEILAKQMAELKRKARKIVWLNPLLGTPGYEPKQQGIQAALPYVDLFAPAHNLESLMALENALTKI